MEPNPALRYPSLRGTCESLKNWGFPNGGNPHGNGATVVVFKQDRRFVCNSTYQGKKIPKDKGLQPNTTSSSLAGGPFSERYLSSRGLTRQGKKKQVAAIATRLSIEISYRQLWDLNFIKKAYFDIKGNMTKGLLTDHETPDSVYISLEWMQNTIKSLQDRSFQFKRKPVSITHKRLIPKALLRDTVIQQAFKNILQAAFEPKFLNTSHGFRPKRSPHTAMSEIRKWCGTT